MKEKLNEFLNSGMNKGLSWTTIASEKLLLAIIGISTCIASAIYLYEMLLQQRIELSDLFMFPPLLLGENKQHVKFIIELEGGDVQAIGFNLAHLLKDTDTSSINICYTITENFWNNRTSLQLILKDFY